VEVEGPERVQGQKGNNTRGEWVQKTAGRVVVSSESFPERAHDLKGTKEAKGGGHGFTVPRFFTVEHGRTLPILVDGGFQGIGQLVPRSILQ
jgi:hypothetical protein